MAEIDDIRRILMCCCLRVSIKSINSEEKLSSINRYSLIKYPQSIIYDT